MKMMYNGTPIKSLNIKHFEVSTNDCTMKASDLQAGVTGVARGKKIVGTGKAFSFATYGNCPSNTSFPIPVSTINTIGVSSNNYAIKMTNTMVGLRNLDYTVNQPIAIVNIDGVDYSVNFKVNNNFVFISCDKDITLQVIFGKDDYTT